MLTHAVLNIIASHLLILVENELMQATPGVVADIEKEIQALATRLLAMISNKETATKGGNDASS